MSDSNYHTPEATSGPELASLLHLYRKSLDFKRRPHAAEDPEEPNRLQVKLDEVLDGLEKRLENPQVCF